MNISRLIHQVDPYDGFMDGHWPFDLQGWGGHSGFFELLVNYVRPDLVIEVGSWKGKSAVTLSNLLDQAGLINSKVLCVDTWLGATEFWTDHENVKRYKSLGLQNGYPSVYYQFLANMVKTGSNKHVVPFPQTSTNAARLLKKNNVQAGLIYIDGSHEYEDVAQDLESYYPLLEEGGIMCGDDYCKHWSGVIRAVDEFAEKHSLIVKTVQMENGPGEAPSDYWRLSIGASYASK